MTLIEKQLDSAVETVCVSIDGRCGAGKTTLAEKLYHLYDCNVFHMDDFFLRDEQKTKDRVKEIGGNVDYERFLNTVLLPLQKQEVVQYQPFSCALSCLMKIKDIPWKRLNIIEGTYSHHPYFGAYSQINIFLDITPEEQIRRIKKRNPKQYIRYIEEWIPKENAYFKKFDIKNISDIVVVQNINAIDAIRLKLNI